MNEATKKRRVAEGSLNVVFEIKGEEEEILYFLTRSFMVFKANHQNPMPSVEDLIGYMKGPDANLRKNEAGEAFSEEALETVSFIARKAKYIVLSEDEALDLEALFRNGGKDEV